MAREDLASLTSEELEELSYSLDSKIMEAARNQFTRAADYDDLLARASAVGVEIQQREERAMPEELARSQVSEEPDEQN